jgi:hypothetical protein
MRMLGAAVAALLLLLMAAPASGDNSPPPQWPFHDGVGALKVLKKNVGGALELERSAERLAKAGEQKQAHSELHNSLNLLTDSYEASEWMTDPFRDANDPWSTFLHKMNDLEAADVSAMDAAGAKAMVERIGEALAKKTAIYALVTRELTHLTCGVLTDDRGPIEVNNTAITEESVQIEVACKEPIKDIKIEFPSTFITQSMPDNGTETVKQSGKYSEVKPAAGAKKDGETDTVQDPVTGEKVEIVVIHGDSVDYFDEVM